MDKLLRDLEKARPYLREPDWQSSELPVSGARHSLARSRFANPSAAFAKRVRRFAFPAAAVAVAATFVLWFAQTQPGPREVTNSAQQAALSSFEAPAPPNPSVTLSDGSLAFAVGSDTRVHAQVDTRQLAELWLEAGVARFEVVKNAERRFRVRAGDVVVEALGTVFTVKVVHDQVQVEVTEGHVRVEWGAQHVDLLGGNMGVFPHRVIKGETPESTKPDPPQSAPAATGGRSWQNLAGEKRFKEAYDALRDSAPRDEPAELLLAADVARQAGHPDSAVRHLERVVQAHPGDPRAPVAAVTLGRVLLELSRPSAAAVAFGRAQTLAPSGVLAETAAAYEVEALLRAGQKQAAEQRGKRFVSKYPNSGRAERVRTLLELE
jgi:transmembrane sensor